METREAVSMNLIIADALQFVDDAGLRKGFAEGWYRSQVQSAVEKLALHTYFDVKTGDYVMPKKKLQDKMPLDCFNIRELYAWSGACCTPQNSAIIHYKRLYNNKPGGADYTALRKDRGSQQEDPFYQPFSFPVSYTGSNVEGRSNLLYANVQNGLIMFSSSCGSWDNYRIVYNGMGGNIGEEPLIPRMLRETIVDMVVERAYRAMKARDPRTYRALWSDAYNHLYNRQTGTYWDAVRIVKTMGSWAKDNYAEYQNRGDW